MYYEIRGNIALFSYTADWAGFFEGVLNSIKSDNSIDKKYRDGIDGIGYGAYDIGIWEDGDIEDAEWESKYYPRMIWYKELFKIITDFLIKTYPEISFATNFYSYNDNHSWGNFTELADGNVRSLEYSDDDENIICPRCGETAFGIYELDKLSEGHECWGCKYKLSSEEILNAIKTSISEYKAGSTAGKASQKPSIVKLDDGDFYNDDEKIKLQRASALYSSCVENVEDLMAAIGGYGSPIVSADSYVKGNLAEAQVNFEKADDFFAKAVEAFEEAEKGYDIGIQSNDLNNWWKKLYNTLVNTNMYFFDRELGVRQPVGAVIAYLVYADPKAQIKLVFDHDKWENRGEYNSQSRVCLELTDYGNSVELYEL